jgi:hypothetical protein
MYPVRMDEQSTMYNVNTAHPTTSSSDDTLMFDSLTSHNGIPRPSFQSVVGADAHAWHGHPLRGFELNGHETQFTSSPASVPCLGHMPVNSGYHIAPRHGAQYDLSFAMSVNPPVADTPVVYHPSADSHLHSTPATLLPTLEATNTAPLMLNMTGACGRDIVIDLIDFHLTTTSPLSPTPDATTSASPLRDSESVPNSTPPPSVRCMIDNCGQAVTVNKDILREHLSTIHEYPASHRSHSVACRWSGCICTRPRTCRSPNLGGNHGVHVEDVTEHIWTTHLNFQDVCGKCGDARWVPGFSLQRHMNGCGGRKPARCKGCCQIFKSTVAFTGHLELGLCEAALVG